MITFATSKPTNVNRMDFVNRLKRFMNSQSIGSTQFADACRIPRPTMSQILSGRNKKISDEVISKIHGAYPSLSVLWLLFGEGNMLVAENNQISGTQTDGFFDISRSQEADNGEFAIDQTTEQNDSVFDAEKSSTPSLFDLTENSGPKVAKFSIADENETAPESGSQSNERQLKITADAKKSIVNITVFYSDNSFQTFLPSNPT